MSNMPKRKTPDLRKAPSYGTLDEQNKFYKELALARSKRDFEERYPPATSIEILSESGVADND